MARSVALAFLTCLALGSCGDADSGAPTGSLDDFVAYMQSTKDDYTPASTPAFLARQVAAVVVGRIDHVEPGQSYAPTAASEAEIVTSVLKVYVERFVMGQRAVVMDGFVYIEIPHPARVGTTDDPADMKPFDHDSFEATVPRARGVFFLDDRTNEPYFETVIDAGAGRPARARLTATYVQGFLIEDPDGRLVSVREPFEHMPEAWRELRSIRDVEEAVRA